MIRPHHRPWHRRLRHSLRWRLVALFLLLALAMSFAFVGGMRQSFAVGWREAVRPLLSDYVDRLVADLGMPPDAARAQALAARLPISVRIDGPLVQFDSHPNRQGQPWRYKDYRDYRDPREEADGRDLDPTRSRLLRRTTADGHTIIFGLGDLDWHGGPGAAVWVTLAVLLGLTAVAFAYVRRLLRPLDDIGAGAARFGAGDFAQPIPVRRRDELGDLARQINTMGDDIHQMLEAKRALLLAISHELRSPLTRARLNTELMPASPDTQPQRDALLRDLAEMGRLITDLLESERLSSRHAALNLALTDVGELVRAAVSDAAGGVEPAVDVAVTLSVAPDLALMLVDPVRIKLLLRNLLSNARRHSVDANRNSGAAVEVSLRQEGAELHMTVRDHGPGVPADQLARLAEPFFRVDSARQRSTGGVGLGLYLCRLVAQAHGGSLTLRNANPGLRVTLALPLAPAW